MILELGFVVHLAVVGMAVASSAGDGHVGGVNAGGGLEAVHVAHGVGGVVEAGHGGENRGGENLGLVNSYSDWTLIMSRGAYVTR